MLKNYNGFMQKLGAREENILDYLIRDYIRTASPVSSGKIFGSGLFRLSPATIRNAMLNLDGEGYLEQPYTSSGRVPTDKAYRYFVDNLMSHKVPSKKERTVVSEIMKDMKERHEIIFEDFVKTLSEELGLFTGIANFSGNPKIEGFGLERVFSEPEFDDHGLTVEFSRLIDNLEGVARNLLEESSDARPEIFIGKESSPEYVKEFSAVAIKFLDEDLGESVIFSLGPKRMNYEKTYSVYSLINNEIKEVIE